MGSGASSKIREKVKAASDQEVKEQIASLPSDVRAKLAAALDEGTAVAGPASGVDRLQQTKEGALTISVTQLNGRHVLNVQAEPSDFVRSLREKVQEAVGGLDCHLVAPSGEMLEDDSALGGDASHVNVVIDATSLKARYRAAGLAVEALCEEDWLELASLDINAYHLSTVPLEQCAELTCRILAVEPNRVVDDAGFVQNEYWSVARHQIFADPACLLKMFPVGATPLAVDLISRVLKHSEVFEFAEHVVGESSAAGDGADEGAEDYDAEAKADAAEGAEDDDAEGEGCDAEEAEAVDYCSMLSEYPRAVGRLMDWVFAVKAVADAEFGILIVPHTAK